jgi:hypothetical protein
LKDTDELDGYAGLVGLSKLCRKKRLPQSFWIAAAVLFVIKKRATQNLSE